MPHKSDVQVALISGGTSGIGFATAKLLLKEGWCVVINGRNEKSGQKAKTKLRRYSSKVQYIQGDVSKLEDCQRIVKETVDVFENEGVLEKIKSYGFQGMPVVVLDDNFANAWAGYNPDRLEELEKGNK